MTKFLSQLAKNWYWVGVVLLLLISLLIRGYQFTAIPAGLTWDETAIGYNGFAIWNTRRDEWLHKLPISFQSFGDYKAPLAIYMSSFFTAILGLTVFAVRVPFVLAGVATILGSCLLASELFYSDPKRKQLSLLFAALLTFSPWHIHFSRGAFESGLALTLYVWGLYFLLYGLRSALSKQVFFSMLASGVSFVLALYAYHSAKIVIPFVLVVFLFLYGKRIISLYKPVGIAVLLATILLIPLLYDSFWGSGLTRANVTLFSNQNLSTAVVSVGKNLALHLSPAFLIQGATTTLRHSDGKWGVLNPITYLLVCIYFIRIIFIIATKRKLVLKKTDIIILTFLFAGLIPAIITTDVPHSNRGLLASIGFLLAAVQAAQYVVSYLGQTQTNHKLLGSHDEKNGIVHAFIGTIIALYFLFFIAYQHHYYSVFPKLATQDYAEGYVEAFQLAREYELGLNGKRKVDKIVFTSEYGQPYIFALFARKTNPIAYHGGSLSTYHFTDPISIADFQRSNALIVASGSDLDIPRERATHVIKGADDSIRFLFFLTDEQ